jgi:hypothetical protein
MAALIAPLISWEPMQQPRDGYSLLIGCNRNLGPMLLANLRLLTRQKRTSCKEVILAIDGTEAELGTDIKQRAREICGSAAGGELPIRFVHYTSKQISVTRMIDWGWIYAWLSWSIGIRECTTRYAMLHDFDALLLNPNVLEERYAQVQQRSVEFLGIAHHTGGGVLEDDKLVRTFELMFDCAFVRKTFKPIELFNTMKSIAGRRVEFDTFLNAQHRAGTTSVMPLAEEEMVHPSQMICQYVDFNAARGRIPTNNNLLMIPYYEHIGGDSSLMRDMTQQLTSGKKTVSLWGKPLSVAAISPTHKQWMRKQMVRMEATLANGLAGEVAAYMDAIDAAT